MKHLSFLGMFLCSLLARTKIETAIFLAAMAIIAAMPASKKGSGNG